MCGKLKLDHPVLKMLMLAGASQHNAEALTGFGYVLREKKPGDNILALLPENGELIAEPLNWGGVGGLYNARYETARQPGSIWHEAWVHNRCLVPVTSFWEKWLECREKDLELSYLAGLAIDRSVVIVTKPADEFVAKAHDRMPVVLPGPWATEWLGADWRLAQASPEWVVEHASPVLEAA